MESEIHYKRVGLFIVLGIGLFVLGIVWLTNYFGSENQKKYIIYFEKQGLDGLQKDSPVTMKGIKIGTVQDYKISEKNIQKVKVIINIEKDVPVKVDSRAAIKRNLLTGLAKIDLIGGTQNSNSILDNGEDLPVIPEEVTQFDKIADSASIVVEKIESSLSRINLILSDKNLKSIESAFSSISNITADLEKMLPQLNRTVNNVTEITNSANNFSKKYIDDSSQHSFSVKAEKIAVNLEIISANLKNLSEETGPMVRSSNRSIQGIQQDIGKISESIKAFTDSYSNPNLLLNSRESSK